MSDGWTTVSQEAPTMVIFDTIGDEFIGQYIGPEYIDLPKPDDKGKTNFRQDTFTGTDGELYGINPGYDLSKALDKVQPGLWAKITYLKDIDTGQPAPMRSFRVQTRNDLP